MSTTLERYALELAKPFALVQAALAEADVACGHAIEVPRCPHCLARSEMAMLQSTLLASIGRLERLSELLGANQCPPEPDSLSTETPLPGEAVKGSGGH